MFPFWDKTIGKIQGITYGSDGRLDVSSRSNPRYTYASQLGNLYSWTYSGPILSGQYAIYIKSTNPVQKLNFESISLSSDVDGIFTPTAVSGDPSGGATCAGVNWSAIATASAVGLCGNVQGLTSLAKPSNLRSKGLSPTKIYNVDGAFILGNGGAVAVAFSASGNVEINLVGYFEK